MEILSMKKKYSVYFEYIMLLIVFVSLCAFMGKYIGYMINSDDSSEMVLSRLLSQEAGILSRNWFYSTELRVLNTQIIWSLLFRISNNWHIVRVWGNIIVYLLMLFCLRLFCKEVGLSRWYALIAILFLLPVSSIYFDIVLRGVYYIPHIAISLLLFGMTFRFARSEENKEKILLILFGFTLSTLAGMGGLRQLLIFYLPMLCAVTLYCLLNNNRNVKTKRLISYTATMTTGAGIGYLINSKILSEIFYFTSYDNITYSTFSIEALTSVVNGWLNVLGYRVGGGVFSIDTLFNAMCGVLVIVTFYSVYYVIRHRNEFDMNAQIIVYFYLSAFVVFLLLFSLTNMFYTDRYNIPIIVFGYPVIFLCFGSGKTHIGKYVIIMIMLLTVTCGMVKFWEATKIDITAGKRDVVSVLTEQGYQAGYATFWNASVLTELSNGEISVWSWPDSPEDIVDVDAIFPWLQLVAHKSLTPSGKVFILLSNEENNKFTFVKKLNENDIIYQSDSDTLYGFNSYDDMIEKVSGYNFIFKDSTWLTNGEDIDGVRTLYPGGISFGPYIALHTGSYCVEISGNNLKEARYDCVYELGSKEIEISNELIEDDHIYYEVTIDENHSDVETRVVNSTSENITIDTIVINRLN